MPKKDNVLRTLVTSILKGYKIVRHWFARQEFEFKNNMDIIVKPENVYVVDPH